MALISFTRKIKDGCLFLRTFPVIDKLNSVIIRYKKWLHVLKFVNTDTKKDMGNLKLERKKNSLDLVQPRGNLKVST